MRTHVIALLGIMLAFMAFGNVGATQADPVLGKGLYFVNLATLDGDTHFRYELRSAGAPAVSHVELAICAARLIAVNVETPDDTNVEVRPGLVKIETPSMGDNETKIITLIMSGTGWNAVSTTYTLKAGQQIIAGETYGPQCSPTAVTLAGLSAEVAGVQFGYIVLLVLAVAAGVVVGMWLRERIRGK